MSAGVATAEAWEHVPRVGANPGLVLLALAWLQDHYGWANASPGQVSRLTPFAESTTAGTLRGLHYDGLVYRHTGPRRRVTYSVRRTTQGARP